MTLWGVYSGKAIEPVSESIIPLLIRAEGTALRGLFLVNINGRVIPFNNRGDAILTALKETTYPESTSIWESAIKFSSGLICHEVEIVKAPRPDADTLVEIVTQLENLTEMTELEKATNDPQTAIGYKRYLRDLLTSWQAELSDVEGEYLDEYLERLKNVDWSKKSEKYIQAEFDILANFVPPCVLAVKSKIIETGTKTAIEIAIRTREALISAKGFDVDLDFNLKDTKAIKNLGNMGSKQIPMTFMKVSAVAANSMRKQLVAGLDKGLNYKVVVADLIKTLPEKVSKTQKNYLEVTAHNLLARARSQGQLLTYRDAGIQYIKASAVIDERTTSFCRWIDDQVLAVEPMVDYYNKAIDTDADPREAFPWVKEKTDKGTGISYFSFQDPSGKNKTFAMGIDGQNFDWRKGWNMQRIQGFGIFPPYHGRCRTTTYYDDEA
jgi:hypothetical protein